MGAWRKFRCGKQSRADVLRYERQLGDNILDLHYSLRNKTYQHGGYDSFFVQDPKHRHIHKAEVRDRLVHHAIVRMIERMFERQFIFDSWSCRKRKGTHAAIERFRRVAWSLSRNNTVPVWVLKMDIAKFFASVDQGVLLAIIERTVSCKDTRSLIANVLRSFDKGLPLGNLTSQLFANVYLNELDQYVKHGLRVPHYLRYCDDFVILSRDPEALKALVPHIQAFLKARLRLQLHPAKITLGRLSEGVDFLGFVCFTYHTVLRTKTKRRMLARVGDKNLSSYLGLISHTRSHKLKQILLQKHHEHRSFEDGGKGQRP